MLDVSMGVGGMRTILGIRNMSLYTSRGNLVLSHSSKVLI